MNYFASKDSKYFCVLCLQSEKKVHILWRTSKVHNQSKRKGKLSDNVVNISCHLVIKIYGWKADVQDKKTCFAGQKIMICEERLLGCSQLLSWRDRNFRSSLIDQYKLRDPQSLANGRADRLWFSSLITTFPSQIRLACI